MSSLDFPLNPIDGQEYSLNGVTYYYNAALGAWLTKLSSAPLPTVFNRQVLFNDAGLSNGSYGLVFDKSANTLFANTINVSSNMRVFGNLQIGTGTVTITNNSISAASIIVDGSAIPSGAAANLAFDTANAAYAAANNVGPQIAPAFNKANAAYNAANVGYATANAAYNAANNVNLSAPFNVANAAFAKANSALQNTSGTFAGNLTVTGTANVIGSLYVTNISHINTYTINYLIVAGGGGGGGSIAGGGGGGGFVTASANVSVGTSLTATVGAGGPNGTNGSDSSLSGFEVALGGGSSPGYNGYGYSGGSGGGGARASGPGAAIQRGGPPRYRQGNCGGNGSNSGGSDNYGSGGGGGGAGGRGGDASGATAGAGGIGATWINGNTYAGGGGGSAYNGTGGPGSDTYGGGGSGTGSNSVGGAGTVNTGGGGGSGGYSGGGAAGGAGGSGIVIIAYLGSQRGSGGTVTSSGGYTYHTFTSSGTFTA